MHFPGFIFSRFVSFFGGESALFPSFFPFLCRLLGSVVTLFFVKLLHLFSSPALSLSLNHAERCRVVPLLSRCSSSSSSAGGSISPQAGGALFSSSSNAFDACRSDVAAWLPPPPPPAAQSFSSPPRLCLLCHGGEGAPEEQDRRGHHDQGRLHSHSGHDGRRRCDTFVFFDAKMPASDGLSGAPRSRSLTSTSASPQLVKKKKALDLLVSKRITGLPVVDGEGVVVSNH
jgi:hypothetical protein